MKTHLFKEKEIKKDMKNPKEMNCDRCGKTELRRIIGRKINGEYLCKSCKEIKRKEHRKETKRNYMKKTFHKKQYKKDENYKPKIKGSIIKETKTKNCCYFTFHERQALFRSLLKKGLNEEEAKERISSLIESQKVLKEKLSKQKVSEEVIKQKQTELLEELWRE